MHRGAETQPERAEKGVPAVFEVVRPHDRGRPLFLNARRFIRICRLIEKGANAAAACKAELVTYAGFRRHVQTFLSSEASLCFRHQKYLISRNG